MLVRTGIDSVASAMHRGKQEQQNNVMEVNYFSTGAVRGNYSVLYHVTPGMCNVTYTSLSGRVSGNMSSDSSRSTCYYRIQNSMAASQIHIRLTSQSSSVADSECNSIDFDGQERRCVGIGAYGTEMTYPYDGDFTITLLRTADAERPSFSLYYNILPANCTQRFTTDTGSFASPADSDGNYMNDLTCTYTISGGSSPYILILNFITLDLQSSSSCSSDYVRFRYRGSSGYTTTTSRYCTGPRSLRYTVSSGDFNVSFVTDGREVRSGFNAIYAKLPVSCNRTYTTDEGIIESTPGMAPTTPTTPTVRTLYRATPPGRLCSSPYRPSPSSITPAATTTRYSWVRPPAGSTADHLCPPAGFSHIRSQTPSPCTSRQMAALPGEDLLSPTEGCRMFPNHHNHGNNYNNNEAANTQL
ncbi:cubilin-like isoform X2 [Haliotis rubra]|uniref:cubilin-like isoform X2 n=1 Tax=Haliotis rubra TaxID=36100 RepID=UPI001EE599FB|nr:cubilin-like isoform X2 [Haliotis rubra]